MWTRQESNNNVSSTDNTVQSPPLTYEECPNCHSRVQSGRFCASCGQRLLSQNSLLPSLINQDNSIDTFGNSNDDYWGGSQNTSIRKSAMILSIINSLRDPNQSNNSLMSFSRSYSTRRFSSDFADGDLFFNASSNNDSNHPSIPISSNLLTHPSSSGIPSRRRAMTSTALGLSGFDGDDSLFCDVYDTDQYEQSQEPLFRNNRTGSVSLDPLDSFGTMHGLRSSVDAPLHTSSNTNGLISASLLPYETNQVSSGLNYSGDVLDDIPMKPIHVGRSLSDVNSSTLDGYDFGNSLFKNYNSISNGNHSIGSNSLLMKRNSTNGLSFNNTNDLFMMQDSLMPQSTDHTQVIKGSMNFPTSRSMRSVSQTSPLSSGVEGQSLSPVSLPSQQETNSPIQKGLATEMEPVALTKTSRRNSLSVPPSHKGRMLEISESKKLSEYSTYCNHVVELVCTQNGSKGLQNYLNSNMSETVREIVIDQIIGEIESTGCKIICDTFGNYFYQLLFKKANSTQKEKLLRAMLMPKSGEDGSTIYDISINKTGTFAFQNIIDFMSGEEVLGKLVMDSLQNSRLGNSSQNVILQLIKENKGTHIIQRIMKTFSIELWEPIYSILLDNCFTIAMDRNGSMVLRLCYDLIDLEKKEKIAKDIIAHSLQLAVDPVGNYVVQHILSIPEKASAEEVVKYEEFIHGVLKELSGHYIELSKQKYSSNVVEKSIVNSAQLGDHAIYDELLEFPAIMQLLENHYGTYVLQKTLQSLSPDELKRIDASFRGSRLVNNNHSMSLLNKWKQIVNKVSW